MNFKIAVAVVAFFICLTSTIAANYVTLAMIGEVNRKLPETEKISYFWFDFGKAQRILSEYRRFYPKVDCTV